MDESEMVGDDEKPKVGVREGERRKREGGRGDRRRNRRCSARCSVVEEEIFMIYDLVTPLMDFLPSHNSPPFHKISQRRSQCDISKSIH